MYNQSVLRRSILSCIPIEFTAPEIMSYKLWATKLFIKNKNLVIYHIILKYYARNIAAKNVEFKSMPFVTLPNNKRALANIICSIAYGMPDLNAS